MLQLLGINYYTRRSVVSAAAAAATTGSPASTIQVIRNKTPPVITTTAAKSKKPSNVAFGTGGRTIAYVRKNKFVLFAVTVLLTNALLAFKPEHLKRPEILARNRLQQSPK